MQEQSLPVEVEEVTDARELAAAAKLREQFDRNSAWLQRHISQIYAEHRGKCICVSGEEVFAADTVAEAVGLAVAAHPEDEGWFTRYIPIQKLTRIYAI
jgi:hypothetical protein